MEILTDDIKEKLQQLLTDDDLQFVDLPKEILCSNCSAIPIFHYIYPCSHPYCRDCYVNIFQKFKRKCRVCKTEIGFQTQQSKKIELAIYKLKAVCPNQQFGCKYNIELSSLLDHMQTCTFSKERQLPKLYNEEKDNLTDFNGLKSCVEKMKITITNLTETIQNLTKNDEQQHDYNKIMSGEKILKMDVQKLTDDFQKMTVDVQNLTCDIQKLFDLTADSQRITGDNQNLAGDIQQLTVEFEKLASDSQKLTADNRKVTGDIQRITGDNRKLANDLQQLTNDVQKLTSENQNIKGVNQKLTVDVQKMISDVQKLTGDNRKLMSSVQKLTGEVRKCTNDNQKLTADIKSLTFSNEGKDRKIEYLNEQILKIKDKSKQLAFEVTKDFKSINQEINQVAKNNQSNQEKQMQNMEDNLTKVENKIEVVNNGVEILATLLDTVDERRKSLTKLQSDNLSQEHLKFVDADRQQVQNNGEMLWKINNYATKRKENATVSSGQISFNDRKHLIQVDLKFATSNLVGTIKFLTDSKGEISSSVFHYRATIFILDQSEGSEKRNWTRVFEPRFGTSAQEWSKSERNLDIAYFYLLENSENRNLYLKDDTIYFRVAVVPLSRLFQNYFSKNGLLIFTINHYARTKQECHQWINPYCFSDYFYSSERGYRMQARLWWLNNNMNFQLLFLVGEYDVGLASYYSHKCTVFVVNQKYDDGKNDLLMKTQILDASVIGEKGVRKRMTLDYCHKFCIPQSRYEKNPFLLNDNLILKVIVEKM